MCCDDKDKKKKDIFGFYHQKCITGASVLQQNNTETANLSCKTWFQCIKQPALHKPTLFWSKITMMFLSAPLQH